jgi:hypothetical protein
LEAARDVAVRRRDLLDDKYAETLLRQAGMPEAEVASFMASARTNKH